MVATNTLEARGVGKKHCRSTRRNMLYGLQDIGRAVLNINPPPGLRRDEFWAVQGVSFSMEAGECLGIIGPNGAGKSTLLKLLNGIFWPDQGKIISHGRVGALIGIGAGFHPMLTGRENIYVSAAILGLNRQEISKRLEAIIEFAELEEFIDVPVKQYSSGMHVRLGFSIAAHAAPDILLVDEILAVGDIGFRRKCMARMKEFVANGGSLVVVTHDMVALDTLCNRCMVLSNGSLAFQGDVTEGADVYFRESTGPSSVSRRGYSMPAREVRYGARECELVSVEFQHQDKDGNTSAGDVLITGMRSTARLVVQSNQSIEGVQVGISFWDQSGILLLTLNTTGKTDRADSLKLGERRQYAFDFDCPLNAGRYLVGAGIFHPDTGHYLDRRLKWKVLNVVAHRQEIGLIKIPYGVVSSEVFPP